MNKFRIQHDDSNEDDPLLSLANRKEKIKRFMKPKTLTKQSSGYEMDKRMYNADEYSTSEDDLRYLKKKPHRIPKKKGKKNSEPRHFSISTSITNTADYERSYVETEQTYVSIYRAFMNKLFPSYFPLPRPLQWRIMSATDQDGQGEKRSGKILVPTGRCSMFPNGMVLETEVGYEVTEICFPESGQTFKLK